MFGSQHANQIEVLLEKFFFICKKKKKSLKLREVHVNFNGEPWRVCIQKVTETGANMHFPQKKRMHILINNILKGLSVK